jgi:hypothetical protein
MEGKTHSVHVPPQQPSVQARRQLNQIVNDSQDILVSVKTAFPFDLFPDSISVDRTQVTITHRRFFAMGGVTSIRIPDILNVTADVGPFFGMLRISTRYFDPDRPYEVRWLWRDDALRLKTIIIGLVVAIKEAVDASSVASNELVAKAAEVGGSTTDEAP